MDLSKLESHLDVQADQQQYEKRILKEITVFTVGDSAKPNTWSNVPYFFTKTLLEKEIRVNRVDIQTNPKIERFWNKTFGRIVRRVCKETSYTYERSGVNHWDICRRIRRALRNYPNSNANLFLTFSFSSARYTSKPTILFCDWTYDYFFRYFANREPDMFEKWCIKREDAGIRSASLILPLFPVVGEYMKERYQHPKIRYQGNVVNSMIKVSKEEVFQLKRNSMELLFVGGDRYLDGAVQLIAAFEILKEDFPRLTLNIVGMNAQRFEQHPPDVFFHGHLDKGEAEERKIYYDLFRMARIFVNTTPKWGAFSASIEAMYFYTPVIVTPYKEFTETFGKAIPFGTYCDANQAIQIEASIRKVLNAEDYLDKCFAAHDAVKEYTWSNYVDKTVLEIEKFL